MPMIEEIWKPIRIPPFEGRYEVSSSGRVRSTEFFYTDAIGRTQRLPSKIRKLSNNHAGYPICDLQAGGYIKRFFVHRLVAFVFFPKAQVSEQVNHKNGIRDDNRIENLEWISASENCKHAFRVLGRKNPATGKFGLLANYAKPVAQICTNGTIAKIWSCAKYAAVYLKISATGITDCCKHRPNGTAGGYKWRYATPAEVKSLNQKSEP